MKRVKVNQTVYIDGSDGHESAKEFNEAMMALAEMNPRFERDGKSFWIFYTVELEEDETTREMHERAGENAHCIDCPYLMRDLNRFGNIDGRKKWGTCGKTGERTCIESRACDLYHDLPQNERRRF